MVSDGALHKLNTETEHTLDEVEGGIEVCMLILLFVRILIWKLQFGWLCCTEFETKDFLRMRINCTVRETPHKCGQKYKEIILVDNKETKCWTSQY